MGQRLLALVGLLLVASCSDPPGDSGLQLYFDVNVDDAPSMGLSNLASFEVITDRVTAKWTSPSGDGEELVLDETTQQTTLPAITQLVPGPYYTMPSGFITQLRFFPTLVRFHFTDGSTADIRVPSAEHTGWKVVVDETEAPNGYELTPGHITGVRLFINLGELFHKNDPQGWMARPTIRSSLYNIASDGGYDPDMLVVVFDPATPQSTIDSIIDNGGFHVEFRYPRPPVQLYKLKIPTTKSLRDAHSYLRGFAAVRAVAPSVRLFPRVNPVEGLPWAEVTIDAPIGWDRMLAATGSIGSPAVVVAEVSATSGGFNIEHPDLWPNIWLNQGEILAVCGTMAQCDPDGDGFVTLKDFNNPAFTGVKPPDVDSNGRITCKDLLAGTAPTNPYINFEADDVTPRDDDSNGFPNDLCGWNFLTKTNDVLGSLCDPTLERCNVDHDTVAAGIMAAVGTLPGNTAQGPGVGLCWNCRLMPIVIGKDPGGLGVAQSPDDAKGVTAEMVGGLLYARDNGAHVANLSAGSDYFKKTSPQQCGLRRVDIKDDAFGTVVAELDAVITASFSDISVPTTLFTLSGGECGSTRGTINDGIDEGASDDYYDWPSEAFFSNNKTRLVSLTVAATDNDTSVLGPVATYSNFGEPFEIAAPGFYWFPFSGAPGSPCALDDTATCPGVGNAGTSFAAPAVAGVAGLLASGNPMAFGTPNAPVLKLTLLNSHTVLDPTGLALIPGNRGLTMRNLP